MTDFEQRFVTLPDAEYARLALRRQRLQSRRAVCPSCGDPSEGICPACLDWYDGLVDAEQLTATRARTRALLADIDPICGF